MNANRQSFTLIELLVVVAIIAVLIAVLLPALNSARGQSRKVVCMNNLRQVGVGFLAYRLDNDGRFPAPLISDGWRWMHMILPYIGDDPTGKEKAYRERVLKCPEGGAGHAYAMNTYKAGRTAYYGWSNRYIDTGASTYQRYHFHENEVANVLNGQHPLSYWVLLFEASGATSATFYRWRTVHPGGSNVLVGDSGVEFWPVNIPRELEVIFDNSSNFGITWQYWVSEFNIYFWRFRGPGWYY